VTALLKSVDLEPVRLEGGKETRLNGPLMFIVPLVLAMLLYTTLAMYGIAVMRSVLDEKSSRIVEVMLSCVTPKELMAGKIMGVGAVGLTQMLIWTLAGAVVSVPALAGVVGVSGGLPIPLSLIIYMPVFFVLGFLLYSASFAALGASVNSEQEAQQFQIIVMMPLILSIVVMWFVIRQPNSPLGIVLSLIPFFAPILMPLRLVVASPPVWQTALCFAMMFAGIYLMVAICARIYRVGILMYGKRATLPEIVRWMRYP
jgi:ABC-2 type transport system permease protein